MIHKLMPKIKKSAKDKIEWRSHEPTRIEAFSDGIFAFGISLLVFSLEIPKNSKELIESFQGFFPFAICFGFIFVIWYWQYLFFRRYGMHDKLTIFLNACLIFLVLFFIYPLKFLFNSMILSDLYKMRPQDVPVLFMFYNGCVGMVYILLALMYANARFNKDSLGLTPVELFETNSHIIDQVVLASVCGIATLVAFIERGNKHGYAVFCFLPYFFLSFVMAYIGKKRSKLFKQKFGDIPMTEPQHGTKA